MEPIDIKDMLRLAQIVRDETGNLIQEKHYSMLESRIRSRFLKLGMNSISEYWKHFSANEKFEREMLQSLMTTHYTFFFREYIHFEMLERWLNKNLPRLKNRYEKTKTPLRVWSAACSRGQEVYSLAMYLDHVFSKRHGIPFEVMGTDIDVESIQYAKNGVYPVKEVNSIPQNYLSSYWKKGTGSIKDFAAIQPSLKQSCAFENLNLLDIPLWVNNKDYDVIFCRNVFIYFAEEKVKQIALDLSSKLSAGGLLVSGVSEPLRFEGWNLTLFGPSTYLKELRITSEIPKSPESQLYSKNLIGGLKIEPQKPEVQSVEPEALKYRVLCVDDSSTIQLLMKKIFGKDPNCIEVGIANNGQEARERLDAKKYDLITLDIHMPVVSGIEFLEKLYRRKEDPPVIMISSVNRTDMDLATKSLSLGAFDYVEKPAMNNLEKSSDEILTKAKLALRSKGDGRAQFDMEFDSTISQKIVVPDASQCARIVYASEANLESLKFIIEGQKAEFRSPAMIVFWPIKNRIGLLESELLKWTSREIHHLRSDKQILKPNNIYIFKSDLKEIFPLLASKSVSLQILDNDTNFLSNLQGLPSIQVLLDEKISKETADIEKVCGRRISDITPSTSFPSLSVEFFANLRKAAA